MNNINPATPAQIFQQASPVPGDPLATDTTPPAAQDDSTLSQQLAQRDAREQFAKDNRQASLEIDLARDQNYIGVGAFGIKGTPAQNINWLMVAPNTASYQNVGALFGATKPTTDDMTVKGYGELAIPAIPLPGNRQTSNESDAFVLIKGTAGLTPENNFELRRGLALIGVDNADQSIVGFGPGKKAGFFTGVFGAAVDFKSGKISPVAETLGGQADLLGIANRNRDSATVQVGPSMKTVGYVWVNSSGNGNQIPLASRVARNVTGQPLVGSGVQAFEVGQAVNDALINPKKVDGINGKPVSTTVETMGRTVIGAPLGTTGLAGGLALETRASLTFTRDGKDDITIKYPSGDTVKTTFHELKAKADELLKPVTDMVGQLRTQREPSTYGSPYDPKQLEQQSNAAQSQAAERLRQQVQQMPGYQPAPQMQRDANGTPILPDLNPAHSTARLPGADGKPVRWDDFVDAVSHGKYSGSIADTDFAKSTLDGFLKTNPSMPQKTYNDMYNAIYSAYFKGAIESQANGLAGRRADPQDAATLAALRKGADDFNNWQIHNGYPQLLRNNTSSQLDGLVDSAQTSADATVQLHNLQTGIAEGRFSTSRAATEAASRELAWLAKQGFVSQGEVDKTYNDLWSTYYTSAIKSQIDGLNKAKVATPQDLSTLTQLRDEADAFNNWQIQHKFPQLLRGESSQVIDGWVDWAKNNVTR